MEPNDEVVERQKLVPNDVETEEEAQSQSAPKSTQSLASPAVPNIKIKGISSGETTRSRNSATISEKDPKEKGGSSSGGAGGGGGQPASTAAKVTYVNERRPRPQAGGGGGGDERFEFKTRPRKLLKAKTPFEWTKADVMLLLDLFQEESNLYDPKNGLYKNKNARSLSFEKIKDYMSVAREEITFDDVKTKIYNLRGQFSSQLSKIRKWTKSGMDPDELEQPYWFEKLQFLEQYIRVRQPETSFSINNDTEPLLTEPDLLYAEPEEKRARMDDENDSQHTLMERTVDAIEKQSGPKFSPAVESFGEFVKSQAALVPLNRQDQFFQQVLNCIFECKNAKN